MPFLGQLTSRPPVRHLWSWPGMSHQHEARLAKPFHRGSHFSTREYCHSWHSNNGHGSSVSRKNSRQDVCRTSSFALWVAQSVMLFVSLPTSQVGVRPPDRLRTTVCLSALNANLSNMVTAFHIHISRRTIIVSHRTRPLCHRHTESPTLDDSPGKHHMYMSVMATTEYIVFCLHPYQYFQMNFCPKLRSLGCAASLFRLSCTIIHGKHTGMTPYKNSYHISGMKYICNWICVLSAETFQQNLSYIPENSNRMLHSQSRCTFFYL